MTGGKRQGATPVVGGLGTSAPQSPAALKGQAPRVRPGEVASPRHAGAWCRVRRAVGDAWTVVAVWCRGGRSSHPDARSGVPSLPPGLTLRQVPWPPPPVGCRPDDRPPAHACSAEQSEDLPGGCGPGRTGLGFVKDTQGRSCCKVMIKISVRGVEQISKKKNRWKVETPHNTEIQPCG